MEVNLSGARKRKKGESRRAGVVCPSVHLRAVTIKVMYRTVIFPQCLFRRMNHRKWRRDGGWGGRVLIAGY